MNKQELIDEKRHLANSLTAFIGKPLDNPLTRSEIMEAARIALASLTAEPGMWEINNPGEGSYFMPEKPREGDYQRDLILREWFTAPPAPVDLSALVPDEPNGSDAPSHLDEYEATCWIAGACWHRAETLRRIEQRQLDDKRRAFIDSLTDTTSPQYESLRKD